MPVFSNNKYNPNPLTKFFVMILLSFTVLHPIPCYFEWAILIGIAILYGLNHMKKEAIKVLVIFGLLSWIPTMGYLEQLPFLIKVLLSLIVVYRMFYLPYTAAVFTIKTSDVGSIISSLDKIKVPKEVSIPMAVIFRFFPSFKEEKFYIKQAMKIRGISFKNPLAYIEYVSVPLLIISSNIADDIAKAAETKCIENPVLKTRYMSVNRKSIDVIYAGLMLVFVIGGSLC